MIRLGLLGQIWDSAISILKGLKVTIRRFFSRPITVRYPDERFDYPRGIRGIPSLKVNPDTGDLNCTACGLCARACPVGVIEVEAVVGPDGKKKQYPARYNLDYTRCLVCNLCVEACPFDSLEMSDMTELSRWRSEHLVFDRDELAEIWKRSRAVRIAGGEKI